MDISTHRTLSRCANAFILLNALACSAHAEDYQQWVGRYSEKSLNGKLVVLTWVTGEDEAARLDPDSLETGIAIYHCAISPDGALSTKTITDRDVRGGSGHKIPPENLPRLNVLLAKLPDDGQRLPPPDRRVMVQTINGTQPTARVYDRANLPEEIMEILRLSESGIPSWAPTFASKSNIEAASYGFDGFLCLSPDRKTILYALANGPLQFWEPLTHETLGDIRIENAQFAGMFFSPDGSTAVMGSGTYTVLDAKTWKKVASLEEPRIGNHQAALSHPHFTPDGKLLLLRCSTPALRVFDTTTWQRVAPPAWLPPDAVQVIPASKSNRAVIETSTGAILLWDADRHTALATLDKNCSIEEAVFSPDESLLATVTRAQTKPYPKYPRIRLWNAATGEFRRELRPYEQAVCESVLGTMWSSDGKYLLAATKADRFFTSIGIGVWNTKTGRFRGEFVGCPTTMNGFAVLPDASQLVGGCIDGKIRFWDFATAMKQIAAFDASLTPPPPAK